MSLDHYIAALNPQHTTNMAKIVFIASINEDRQSLNTIVPLDSKGRPAQVDGGFNKEGAEGGDANVIADPRSTNPLDIIVKPGNEVGATTTVSGYIDADMGEGVKRLDIDIVITTIAAEAVGATLTSRGDEPLGAESTEGN